MFVRLYRAVTAPGMCVGPAPGMLCTRYLKHQYIRQVVPRGSCTRYAMHQVCMHQVYLCTRYVMHQVYSSGCTARVLHQVCYAPGMYAPSLSMHQVCYALCQVCSSGCTARVLHQVCAWVLHQVCYTPGMLCNSMFVRFYRAGPAPGMLCTRYVCTKFIYVPGMLCTKYVRQVVPRGYCTGYVLGSWTRYVMHQVCLSEQRRGSCTRYVVHWCVFVRFVLKVVGPNRICCHMNGYHVAKYNVHTQTWSWPSCLCYTVRAVIYATFYPQLICSWSNAAPHMCLHVKHHNFDKKLLYLQFSGTSSSFDPMYICVPLYSNILQQDYSILWYTVFLIHTFLALWELYWRPFLTLSLCACVPRDMGRPAMQHELFWRRTTFLAPPTV